MRFPRPLGLGSRVGLITPAGPLRNGADVERAVASAQSLGWEPVVGTHVLERSGYFAGTDEQRAGDFNRMADDDSIDGIWCIRGGYGTMRILDDIDYDVWREKPKTLIGYSDITALHAAIGAHADLVSFHGPTARAQLTEFSRTSLHAATITGMNSCGVATDALTLRGGRASGRLAGGNLALLSSLVGTRYEVNLDGAILVLEDVNEAVYRIDRMLTQLRLAGCFEMLAGIAFGRFTDIAPPEDAGDDRPLLDLLQEVAARCAVPCLANIPLGHIADQWTIPLGATAELDADAKSLIVLR